MKKPMSANLKFNKYVSRSVGQDLLLLNSESGDVFKLNSTAKFIWDKISKGLSKDDIAVELEAEYDVTLDLAKKEVNKFIESLTL